MYTHSDGTRYNRDFEKVEWTEEEKMEMKKKEKRLATFNALKEALVSENMTKFESLLESCEDPNIYDGNYEPIMATAINLANEQAITMLINRGANVDVITDDRKTCLTVALNGCVGNNSEAVIYSSTLLELVLNKLDSDEVSKEYKSMLINMLDDHDKNTPLLLAFKSGSKTMTDLIIKHGGDIDNQEFLNKVFSEDANDDECRNIATLLLQYGMNPTLQITDVVKNGHIKTASLLLTYNANVEPKINSLLRYDIPLLDAIKNLDFDMANMLLDNGCPAGKGNVLNTLMTSLNVYYKHPGLKDMQAVEKMAQRLIEKGCDVNYTDALGETPIMSLCKIFWDTSDLVKCLILNGANINHKSKSGLLPIMIACFYGNAHINVINLLFSKGALKNMNDYDIRHTMNKTNNKPIHDRFKGELKWRARKDLLLVKKKSPIFSKMPDEMVRKVACYLDYEDWNTFFKIQGRRR